MEYLEENFVRITNAQKITSARMLLVSTENVNPNVRETVHVHFTKAVETTFVRTVDVILIVITTRLCENIKNIQTN